MQIRISLYASILSVVFLRQKTSKFDRAVLPQILTKTVQRKQRMYTLENKQHPKALFHFPEGVLSNTNVLWIWTIGDQSDSALDDVPELD